MRRFKEFLKKNGIYVLLFTCLLFGLSSLIFRNATLDDDLYLWETSIMTEALSRGEWIGDYAVGTHGFLFKLPIALIFLLTGPSLEIATIWNILLSCMSLYIFYLILKKYFKKESIALVGVLLLLTSFQFFLHVPTYMREIPVLFSFLLFLYLLQEKKSYWLVGLSLLLIFDAKEYVLFMIIPGLVIYLLWSERERNMFRSIPKYISTFIKIFLPTLLLLSLMIFTRIVPVNMYALSIIPGVTKGGMEYHLKHFDVEVSTTNRIEEGAPSIQEELSGEEKTIEKVINTVKSYIGKILYPRTFSFISIPKIIIFPAIFSSIYFFKRKIKRKDTFYSALFFLFWSFLLVFLLRASFDRYILPILPVIFFFYIYFLKGVIKEKKVFISTVILSGVLALLGMFFEVDYILIKVGLNILILAIYLLYSHFHTKIPNLFEYVTILVAGISLLVVLFFFYANGQLRYYIRWGKDFEVKQVVSHFEQEEKIILNDVGWDILPKLYRGDRRFNPEWKWELSEWIPRKKYFKMFESESTYTLFSRSIETDRKFIEQVGIRKIGLLVSNLEGYPFGHEYKLEEYRNANWLDLNKIVELKNKTLYIFEVK